MACPPCPACSGRGAAATGACAAAPCPSASIFLTAASASALEMACPPCPLWERGATGCAATAAEWRGAAPVMEATCSSRCLSSRASAAWATAAMRAFDLPSPLVITSICFLRCDSTPFAVPLPPAEEWCERMLFWSAENDSVSSFASLAILCRHLASREATTLRSSPISFFSSWEVTIRRSAACAFASSCASASFSAFRRIFSFAGSALM
mmetsp:Transcript_22993/g.58091  ORF Transcript_22993/g.58091 Transcript_22993/m.58091 type:complete len:210 (-) Transcript_22993:406-1035(-)